MRITILPQLAYLRLVAGMIMMTIGGLPGFGLVAFFQGLGVW